MYTLFLLPDRLAIVRLEANAMLPEWAITPCEAVQCNLLALVRTADELSIVCNVLSLPADIADEAHPRVDRGWRALKVQGPLDFSLVGVLATLTAPLAQARVTVFAISTYDTDYILIKETNLYTAMMALRQAGHEVHLDLAETEG